MEGGTLPLTIKRAIFLRTIIRYSFDNLFEAFDFATYLKLQTVCFKTFQVSAVLFFRLELKMAGLPLLVASRHKCGYRYSTGLTDKYMWVCTATWHARTRNYHRNQWQLVTEPNH